MRNSTESVVNDWITEIENDDLDDDTINEIKKMVKVVYNLK